MNQNYLEQLTRDYIQNYLRNEYMDDLRFIFQKDYEYENGRSPCLRDFNAADAKSKIDNRAETDSLRHFVFSSIFLYQLMAYITIKDDMNHNGYKSPNEAAYEEFMDSDKFQEFLDHSGWPDFGLDIWQEFSAKYSQKKIDGLNELLDRYGLVIPFLNYRFRLASIFDVLQRLLQEELFRLDISNDVKSRIVDCANENTQKMLSILLNTKTPVIEDYLQHEYKEDIKNIFEDREKGWFGIDDYERTEKWADAEKRNLALSEAKPGRHFVLSSVLLFHFAVGVAINDERYYKHTFSEGIDEFYGTLTGWPRIGLNYWKMLSKRDPEVGFQAKDVHYILNLLGLMRNVFPDRSSEFVLSCIFDAMQGLLDDALLKWNIPDEAKSGISTRVQSHLNGIMAVLKVGYNSDEQKQDNNDVGNPASRKSKFEIFSDVEFMDV